MPRPIADAATLYDVPVTGITGTLHEEVYRRRGVGFLPEFFVDLDYDDEGHLIITREHEAVAPELAASRAVAAVRDRSLTTVGGKTLPVHAETICIHSDTPNAVRDRDGGQFRDSVSSTPRERPGASIGRKSMAKHEIRSPIPGTFYRKPAPEEPPFVEIGDTVARGDVVALVEVMKSFHQIKADAEGTVSGFPLEDGEPVTAGSDHCRVGLTLWDRNCRSENCWSPIAVKLPAA